MTQKTPKPAKLELVGGTDFKPAAPSKPESSKRRGIFSRARDIGGKVLDGVGEALESGITGNTRQMLEFNVALKEVSERKGREKIDGMLVKPGHTTQIPTDTDRMLGESQSDDGISSRELVAVMQMGLSTVGVVIGSHYDDDQREIETVYLVQMPYGKVAEGKVAYELQQPAKVLYEGNLDEIEQSTHEGFDQFTITRAALAGDDGAISRDCQAIFTAYGSGLLCVDAGQHTVEPTNILTADSYAVLTSNGTRPHRVIDPIIRDLQDSPQKWDPLFDVAAEL